MMEIEVWSTQDTKNERKLNRNSLYADRGKDPHICYHKKASPLPANLITLCKLVAATPKILCREKVQSSITAGKEGEVHESGS